MKAKTLHSETLKTELKSREPIWETLSLLYLDTELQEDDYKFIAKKLFESNKTIKELKEINTFEIYPVLKYNLISVTGVWQGFEPN